jgi:hypothetical protein
MTDHRLTDDLVAMLTMTRDAEREPRHGIPHELRAQAEAETKRDLWIVTEAWQSSATKELGGTIGPKSWLSTGPKLYLNHSYWSEVEEDSGVSCIS